MEFYFPDTETTAKQKQSTNWDCSDSHDSHDSHCSDAAGKTAPSLKQALQDKVRALKSRVCLKQDQPKASELLSFAEACIVIPYYQVGKLDLRRINLDLYALCVFMAATWVSEKMDFSVEYNGRIYTLDEAAENNELSTNFRQSLPVHQLLFKFTAAFDTSEECDLASAIYASPGLIPYPQGFYSLIGVFTDPIVTTYLLSHANSYRQSLLDRLVKRKLVTKRRRFFSTTYQFTQDIVPTLTCLMLHVRTMALSNFSSDRQEYDPELSNVDSELYRLAVMYSTAYISKLPIDYDSSFQIPSRSKAKLAERRRMLASTALSLWKTPMLKLQPEDVSAREILGSSFLAEALGYALHIASGT